MIFSLENGVITVALQLSCDASTGIQYLKFSYDAERNAYTVHRQPFYPDIAISQVVIKSDFSGGYVTIHFKPEASKSWGLPGPEGCNFVIPVDYFLIAEKPHDNEAFRCDREQVNQYEPACVHPPSFN